MVKKDTVERWGIDCIKFVLADDGTSVKMVYCSVCREFYREREGGMRMVHGLKGAVSSLADKWVLGTEVIKKSNAVDHVTKSSVHRVAAAAQGESCVSVRRRKPAKTKSSICVLEQHTVVPESIINEIPQITTEQREQLVKTFQLLHYLVTQGKSFEDFKHFAKFEVDVHKVDLGSEYLTKRAARNMCRFLTQKIKQDEITNPLNSAKSHYFSLMSDRCTCTESMEIKEVFVIKTCNAGKPSFQVMSIEDVDNTNVHCLKKALEQSVGKQNFLFERRFHQIGNGSDGVGVSDELFSLEQEDVGDHLVKGWCANHKVEVGVHDSFKHGELNKASENLVDNIFHLFNRSHLKWRLFKFQAKDMDVKPLKYKRASGTLWVANQVDSLNSYLSNLPILLAFLHQQIQSPYNSRIKDAKPVLEGHLKATLWLELLLYMAVKHDLLVYLSPFTQLVEKNLLLAPETLSSMKSAMQVISRIKHILDEEGSAGFYTDGLFPTLASLILPHLETMKHSSTRSDEKTPTAELHTFHGFKMTTGLETAFSMVYQEIQEVLGYMEVNLNVKFSDFLNNPVYHAAAVFLDTKSYQYNSADVIVESALMVHQHFSSVLSANFCEFRKLRQEFGFLYNHVTTFLSRSTNEQAWQQLFASQSSLSITNILHIAEICIVLPVSSSDLQRIFGRFSRIVSRSSLPLKNESIENELIVGLNDFDNFHPGRYDAIIDEFLRHHQGGINTKSAHPPGHVKSEHPFKRKRHSQSDSELSLKKNHLFLPSEIKTEMQPEMELSASVTDTPYVEQSRISYTQDTVDNFEPSTDDSSFDSTDFSSASEDNM
ncbi:uncharacterized protein LOC121379880 [Gigantopelta aegis]|uniref:uncharacterized protein LOC121379880 n=1 Tax=Gigantopelta aegis TaxID=1735272 RepID=UPI001B889DF7|nr:uncharacterized protein LOC121379880 [Gigantopelta aegis]